MNEFLSFKRMITPIIIQILFWLFAAITVIVGIVVIATAGGGASLLGLLIIILGPIMVRVYCELIIVMFRVYETLVRIDRNTGGAGETSPAAQAPPTQP